MPHSSSLGVNLRRGSGVSPANIPAVANTAPAEYRSAPLHAPSPLYRRPCAITMDPARQRHAKRLAPELDRAQASQRRRCRDRQQTCSHRVGNYGARRRLPISEHRNRLDDAVDDVQRKLASVKGVMDKPDRSPGRQYPHQR